MLYDHHYCLIINWSDCITSLIVILPSNFQWYMKRLMPGPATTNIMSTRPNSLKRTVNISILTCLCTRFCISIHNCEYKDRNLFPHITFFCEIPMNANSGRVTLHAFFILQIRTTYGMIWLFPRVYFGNNHRYLDDKMVLKIITSYILIKLLYWSDTWLI